MHHSDWILKHALNELFTIIAVYFVCSADYNHRLSAACRLLIVSTNYDTRYTRDIESSDRKHYPRLTIIYYYLLETGDDIRHT